MAGELILIVEDNDKNLKLVRDLSRSRATGRSRRAPPSSGSPWPASIGPT
jgi:hypothetical protein